jgi:phage gp46-like protein
VVVSGGGGANTFRVHGACTISDIIAEGAGIGLACFRLNTAGVTLERCTARNYAGFGVYSVSNAQILNRVRLTGAGAVTAADLNGGTGGVIANLLIDGTHATGLRPAATSTVVDLTITGCTSRGLSDEAGATVRNIVAVDNPGVGIYQDDAGSDVDYYCVHGNGTATAFGAGGGTLGVHAVAADPLYAVDLLSMDPASPVRDAGTATGVVEDFVGGTRPVAAEDIGHLEFQSTPPVVLTATAPDLTTVVVTFDQPMTPATVETAAQWTIASILGGGAVSVVSAQSDGSAQVRLVTTVHSPDAVYRVTAPATAESTAGDVVNPAADTADYVTVPAPVLDDPCWGFLNQPSEEASEAVRPFLWQCALMALCCDRRATAEHGDPLGDGDPRGWAGDYFAPAGRPPVGSWIWTALQGRATAQTATAIQDYARESLTGLVDEGLALSADATAVVDATGSIRLVVTLDGETRTFADLWSAWEATNA